ncbi:ribosome hibernation-promoting factor, HPF/YfiA family [Marinilactibacillus sp. Marseille-P9653]|uniref:ribosome hibernation-promoting factor, HPF/YfiA family n=1 Tax=Marinilactibacillus sp. Marseille-P9653 TaxID=2866583 RepID=UPI001CE435F2|nr:ribosome-associated translation inhibitor RaiA [Marinilactibacillus sp. Marseille-P9653]
MLRYNVRGENIEVTQAIRDYVEKKVGKIEKYFKDVPEANAHVNLKTYSDKTAKVEVTVPLPYIVLRAEETSPDLYGSVDLVVSKLERQMRKYKTKINRKNRKSQGVDAPQPTDPDLWADLEAEDDEATEEEIGAAIVRTKRLSLKPMNAEEAILQMDMLGHNFFIFEDADTNGSSIVYKRKDGKYGLIETD